MQCTVAMDETRESEPSSLLEDLDGSAKTVDLTAPFTLVKKIEAEFKSKKPGVNNYLKGCKWAPDGLCLLTCSQDNCLRLFNNDMNNPEEELLPVLRMTEGDLVYDYNWYPLMDSTDPATCVLASTSRNAPIHLWDAYFGNIRATYRAYNQADEVISAVSVAFNPDGTKIYAGFNKMIRVFDTSMPGRRCEERSTIALNKQGQRGLLSCITFSKADPKLFAVGSYSKQICLYDTDGETICIFEGHTGGVTHLTFSPDGSKLYSGGRNDPDILCWDTRNFGKILQVMQRDVQTNQRMYFDVDPSGKYLASGNDDGSISVWDLATNDDDNERVVKPSNSFQAHGDCVNGISIHPSGSLMASSSGKRVFPDISEDDEEEFTYGKLKTAENSVKFWLNEQVLIEPNGDSQVLIEPNGDSQVLIEPNGDSQVLIEPNGDSQVMETEEA